MRFVITIFFSVLMGVLNAQTKAEVEYNKEHDIRFLVGESSWDDFVKVGFDTVFLKEYRAYKPQDSMMQQLQNQALPDSIIVVLATWCHDSKVQLPRFVRVLHDLGYADERIKFISVDLKKQAGKFDISAFNIERVPTFIFYKNGQEFGRIIEKPVVRLESDFYTILNKD